MKNKRCPLKDEGLTFCIGENCEFFLDTDHWVGCCVPGFVDALLTEIHNVDQKQP